MEAATRASSRICFRPALRFHGPSQEFQSDTAVQDCIFGKVHHTQSALANFFDHSIMRDKLSSNHDSGGYPLTIHRNIQRIQTVVESSFGVYPCEIHPDLTQVLP